MPQCQFIVSFHSVSSRLKLQEMSAGIHCHAEVLERSLAGVLLLRNLIGTPDSSLNKITRSLIFLFALYMASARFALHHNWRFRSLDMHSECIQINLRCLWFCRCKFDENFQMVLTHNCMSTSSLLFNCCVLLSKRLVTSETFNGVCWKLPHLCLR